MLQTLSNGHFCLVCKEFADPRFGVNVQQSDTELGVTGHLCSTCFNAFLSSGTNAGPFRAAKLKAWFSGWRKDPFRNL